MPTPYGTALSHGSKADRIIGRRVKGQHQEQQAD